MGLFVQNFHAWRIPTLCPKNNLLWFRPLRDGKEFFSCPALECHSPGLFFSPPGWQWPVPQAWQSHSGKWTLQEPRGKLQRVRPSIQPKASDYPSLCWATLSHMRVLRLHASTCRFRLLHTYRMHGMMRDHVSVEFCNCKQWQLNLAETEKTASAETIPEMCRIDGNHPPDLVMSKSNRASGRHERHRQ